MAKAIEKQSPHFIKFLLEHGNFDPLRFTFPESVSINLSHYWKKWFLREAEKEGCRASASVLLKKPAELKADGTLHTALWDRVIAAKEKNVARLLARTGYLGAQGAFVLRFCSETGEWDVLGELSQNPQLEAAEILFGAVQMLGKSLKGIQQESAALRADLQELRNIVLDGK